MSLVAPFGHAGYRIMDGELPARAFGRIGFGGSAGVRQALVCERLDQGFDVGSDASPSGVEHLSCARRAADAEPAG